MKRLQKIQRRMPLLVGVLALVLAAMWMLSRCSHERRATFALTDSRPGDDTLVVAIEMSPLLYTRSADSIAGLDYDIIRATAAAHGLPVRFRPFVPLHFALKGLENGDFDVVVAALPITERTQAAYNMTRPVYIGRQALVQRADTDAADYVRSQEQLAGKDVWLVAKSPYADRLTNLGAELGDTIYVHSSDEYSAEHLCLLTAAGKIPRAVVNEATARRMAADCPDLDVSVPVSFNQFQSWAVGREALRDSFNVWLDEFCHTAAYDSLLTRYGLHE